MACFGVTVIDADVNSERHKSVYARERSFGNTAVDSSLEKHVTALSGCLPCVGMYIGVMVAGAGFEPATFRL